MVQLQSWFFKYNAWSFTKHRLWNECKRAYYFNYIAPAVNNNPLAGKLRKLKKLDSTKVLLGKLIHDVIEKELTSTPNENNARQLFLDLLEAYLQDPTGLLVEPYNGAPVGDTFFDYVRSQGLDQLSLFFWSSIARVK